MPIFKKMGLVASDGSPTELYSRFKTDSGRGSAALQAIKNAYPEIGNYVLDIGSHKC